GLRLRGRGGRGRSRRPWSCQRSPGEEDHGRCAGVPAGIQYARAARGPGRRISSALSGRHTRSHPPQGRGAVGTGRGDLREWPWRGEGRAEVSAILGCGRHLPGTIVGNEVLAPSLGTTPAALFEQTGIAGRHYVTPGLGPSDIGTE